MVVPEFTIWPGNATGSSRRSWKVLMGRRTVLDELDLSRSREPLISFLRWSLSFISQHIGSMETSGCWCDRKNMTIKDEVNDLPEQVIFRMWAEESGVTQSLRADPNGAQ